MGSGINHFEIRLDGGGYLDLGTNTTHLSAGIPDGRHEVVLKAVDGAGNVHEQRVTYVASSARLGDDLLIWILAATLGLAAGESAIAVMLRRKRRVVERPRTPRDPPPR